MTRYLGFSYDAKAKTAHFDGYVPGSAGKLRRRKTVSGLTRKGALDAWRTFVNSLAVSAHQPEAPPPEIPTLAAFVASTYSKISAGFKRARRAATATS